MAVIIATVEIGAEAHPVHDPYRPLAAIRRSRGTVVGMLTKAIIGTVAATAVGVGGASIASAASNSTPAHPGHHASALKRLAARAVHGEIVTKDAAGNFVTHDLIHGVVTSVSASSITVLAADKTSETYIVTSATHVRQRSGGTGSPSSISAVHKGDQVYVLGTGTTTLTAKRVVDIH